MMMYSSSCRSGSRHLSSWRKSMLQQHGSSRREGGRAGASMMMMQGMYGSCRDREEFLSSPSPTSWYVGPKHHHHQHQHRPASTSSSGLRKGLMMRDPLLIANLIKHADRHHPETEIVSRRHEGDIDRYTYR